MGQSFLFSVFVFLVKNICSFALFYILMYRYRRDQYRYIRILEAVISLDKRAGKLSVNTQNCGLVHDQDTIIRSRFGWNIWISAHVDTMSV